MKSPHPPPNSGASRPHHPTALAGYSRGTARGCYFCSEWMRRLGCAPQRHHNMMPLWRRMILLGVPDTRTTNEPAVTHQNILPPISTRGVQLDCGCVAMFSARRIDTLANGVCTTLVPSGRDDGDGGCSSGSAKTWLTGGRNRQRTTNEWIYVREERSNDALEARSKVVDREREIGWLVHPRSTPWSTAEKIGCTPNKIAFFYGHRRFTIRKVFTATKMWIKHNPKNGVVHILKNAIESCSRDVM